MVISTMITNIDGVCSIDVVGDNHRCGVGPRCGVGIEVRCVCRERGLVFCGKERGLAFCGSGS